MSDPLTRVEIVFLPDYLNHWLRFGTPGREHALDRRRALALFAPGRVFGYVRWWANEYGTRGWRFTVVETAAPGRAMSRIEGVHPGGHILLSADGAARVKRALGEIDALEAAGFEPPVISPDHYRHVHNRIATGQPIRPYDHDRHAAHRAALRARR